MTTLSYYDTTILSLGALFLGLVMLVKGGNWAVDAAVYIARRYGISPMLVGFTIIAFGTSMPELIVGIFANVQDAPDITMGNVLGSNIANILLVLGVSAMFVTLRARLNFGLLRDIIFMSIATLFLAGLLYYGEVGRMIGVGLMIILIGYVIWQYKTADDDSVFADDMNDDAFANMAIAFGTLIVGMICIALGAEFLVKGAKTSATLLGIPEAIVALSIIAFGTSLPELSTSIIAARKGESEMVIGNIIGSNVFNILMIVGFASIIAPIKAGSLSPQLANLDIWITFSVGILLSLVLVFTKKISRPMGLVFFLLYLAYNIYIFAVNI